LLGNRSGAGVEALLLTGPLGRLRTCQVVELLPLARQMRRHLVEDILEHGGRVERRPLGERAEARRLFPTGDDVRLELLLEGRVALLRPLAEADQVLLETGDGIAERPGRPLLLRPVARRIVAGRVCARPVCNVLEQRRPAALARALRRPSRDGVNREKIVAVDTYAGDAVSRPILREGAPLTAGETLEGRDRPLIVDDVENHWRLIDGRERHPMVEVRLRARAFADPGRGDVSLALDGRRHCPAPRLWKLGSEVAGDREDVARARVIHDGHLPPAARVTGIRQTLPHEVDEAAPADDEEPLIAVRREKHVARLQRHPLRNRHGFLAGRLHIEGNPPLTLHALHAVIEETREQHVAQPHLQLFRLEVRIPGTHGASLVIEHAHQLAAEILDRPGRCLDIRPGHRPRGGEGQIAEIRLLTRAGRWAGYVQTRPLGHLERASSPPPGSGAARILPLRTRNGRSNRFAIRRDGATNRSGRLFSRVPWLVALGSPVLVGLGPPSMVGAVLQVLLGHFGSPLEPGLAEDQLAVADHGTRRPVRHRDAHAAGSGHHHVAGGLLPIETRNDVGHRSQRLPRRALDRHIRPGLASRTGCGHSGRGGLRPLSALGSLEAAGARSRPGARRRRLVARNGPHLALMRVGGVVARAGARLGGWGGLSLRVSNGRKARGREDSEYSYSDHVTP